VAGTAPRHGAVAGSPPAASALLLSHRQPPRTGQNECRRRGKNGARVRFSGGRGSYTAISTQRAVRSNPKAQRERRCAGGPLGRIQLPLSTAQCGELAGGL
jgi:hypothetical protein